MSTALPRTVERVISGYRRRWRLVRVHSGFFLTVAILGSATGAAVAADRLLRLVPTARLVAFAAIVVCAVACLSWLVAWPALRRLRDRQAAAELGQRFPEAQEDLVSAVELSRERHAASPGLIRSALERIAERTKWVDYRAAVPLRPVAVVVAAAAVVVAAFLVAYRFRPEAVSNALLRLFRPSEEIPYFCYTKLSISPGDTVLCRGDELTLKVVTTRRPARLARLYLVKNGKERRRVELPCEDGVASWKSGPLFDDIRYRVAAGDALSPWHHVRVVPPPAVKKLSAIVQAPDYAGKREKRLDEVAGSLEVIRGSTISLVVTPSRRGDGPKFRCGGEIRFDGKTIALQPQPDGSLVSGAFVPEASGRCAIALSDGFGLKSKSADGLALKVVADEVPRVVIERPGRDLFALPHQRLTVEATAEDEFGIRALTIAFRSLRGGEPERWKAQLLAEGGPDKPRLRGQWGVDLEQFGLSPGQVLEYRAEAADFAGEALFRRGRSRTFRVTILSEMEHLEMVMRQMREMAVELLRRAAAQNAQASEAGRLAEAAAERAVGEEARRARDRQLNELRRAAQLSRRLKALTPQLAQNPATPERTLAAMERVSRALTSVANGSMRNAANQFGQAATSNTPIPMLRGAGNEASEAARQLEHLARVVEGLARGGILERLASKADAIAARQRGLRENLLPIARKSLGADPSSLSKDERGKLERLASAQEAVGKDIEELSREIARAAGELAFSSTADAATASKAHEKLKNDKVAERAERVARRLKENALFSQLPEQEGVAHSLNEVADILRQRVGSEQLDALARELEEFIRRQKEVNSAIDLAIKKDEKALRPPQLGTRQSDLQRDVLEQAAALFWLARELAGFRSRTANLLEAAGKEMGLGASALFQRDLPTGLDHGKRALAILEQAREQFRSESQQLQQAAMNAQVLEAILLLQRCILGQKRVIELTTYADRLREKAHEDFDRMAVRVGKNQADVETDTKKLRKKLSARFPRAAAVTGKAAEKMALSRIALGAGDTGKETREVQRMALALLEQLISDPRNGLCGACAGAQGMMGMMAAGATAGGFTGGANAPIFPATLGEAANETWRRVHERFTEKLGAAADVHVPPRFRELLDAYYETLRKEATR